MKKLRVILIDDEMLIRKLIRMKIDTERLNIEVVGEYSNGADAIEDLLNSRPDIVISDICMPEEDGLTFSEKCVEILPEIKIILVTGYDDFNYARRSIKVGVFDYLLKPVQSEELNSALERASEEIYKIRGQKERQHQLLDEMEKNRSVLRDIYLSRLMVEESEQEDMDVRLSEYGLNISRGSESGLRIAMMVVQEGFYEPELIVQILEETKAFFQSDKGIIALKDLWNRVVIISDNEQMPFAECIDILVSLIKTKYKCHLYAGVSDKFSGWSEIHLAYLSALEFIRNKRMEEKDAGSEVLSQWKKLAESIGNGEADEAQEFVRQCFADAGMDISEMRRKIQGSCQKLCIDLEINQTSLLFTKELAWCYTMEHLEYCLGNIVTELTVRKKIEREENNSINMQKILRYMLDNIDKEELSLNLLTVEFSISSSHLSKMLKSFTGKKYVELQSDMRLLKMLELIHTTKLKDYDIGKMIGIQDPHYLSIWFKKMMGFSITEYRKLIPEITK